MCDFDEISKKPLFKQIPPDSLYVLQHVASTERITLPKEGFQRRCTNPVMFGMFVLSVVVLTLWASITLDIKTQIYPVGICGFICGLKNVKSSKYVGDCPYRSIPGEVDLTSVPVGSVEYGEKTCITYDMCKSTGGVVYFHRCVKKGSIDEREIQFYKSFDRIFSIGLLLVITSMLLAGAASVLTLFAIQRNPRLTIICSILGGGIGFISLGIYLIAEIMRRVFNALHSEVREDIIVDFINVVLLGILSLIVIGIGFLLLSGLYFQRRQVKLLTGIYEEVIATVLHSKLLLIVPAVLSLITTVFILLLSMALGAAELLGSGLLYRLYNVMINLDSSLLLQLVMVAIIGIYTAIMGVWIYLFYMGIHSMVIAGIVADYYFSRGKNDMLGDILKNVKIMTRYHIGTAAAGSYYITFFGLYKLFGDYSRYGDAPRMRWWSCWYFCVLEVFEESLNYVSQKSYVMTAIHGTGFCESGRRAMRLIWHLFLDVLSLDILNDMTLFSLVYIIVSLPLVIVTLGVMNEEQTYINVVMSVSAIIAATTAGYFMSVVSVAVDTTTLCYCEDKLMNDGSKQKPYHMSARLQAVMDEATKIANNIQMRKPYEENNVV